jgi:hypothetical protein
MCPPILAAAAAGMAAIGTGIGALQSAAQSRYAAGIADRNASMSREAAQQERENTRTEAQAHYRRVSALKGQQRARAAAAGVGLDFGTAANVLADTDMLAREDIARIYKRGEQRVRGFDIEASNFSAQANASRSAAKGALVKGVFDVGATALGGAQQYAALKGPKTPAASWGDDQFGPVSGWGTPGLY